jgi:hypothetical protein
MANHLITAWASALLTSDGEPYFAYSGRRQAIGIYLAVIRGKHFAVASMAVIDATDPFEAAAEEVKRFARPCPTNWQSSSGTLEACRLWRSQLRDRIPAGEPVYKPT